MPYTTNVKDVGSLGIVKPSGEAVVSIRELKKSFGEKEVLRGINLEIYKGQIIGYIGPNGAGKSTTVKLMLGILEGFEGEINIFGEDIRNGSVEYKRRIGYVPESADVYESLTAQEYLTFIGEIYGLSHDTADT
jgi:ABC-2 type transport system ATP-binding protein